MLQKVHYFVIKNNTPFEQISERKKTEKRKGYRSITTKQLYRISLAIEHTTFAFFLRQLSLQLQQNTSLQ